MDYRKSIKLRACEQCLKMKYFSPEESTESICNECYQDNCKRYSEPKCTPYFIGDVTTTSKG